jgi:hypothetical protein
VLNSDYSLFDGDGQHAAAIGSSSIFYDLFLKRASRSVRGTAAAHKLSGSWHKITGTRSFWMTPKLASLVIMNLIANLPFLYHKL